MGQHVMTTFISQELFDLLGLEEMLSDILCSSSSQSWLAIKMTRGAFKYTHSSSGFQVSGSSG